MDPCFECGEPTDRQHAVVPGSDRTVPLCGGCFLRLRTGVGEKPKPRVKAGWPLGRPKKITPEAAAVIRARRAEGRTYREIAKEVGVSAASVHEFVVRDSKSARKTNP